LSSRLITVVPPLLPLPVFLLFFELFPLSVLRNLYFFRCSSLALLSFGTLWFSPPFSLRLIYFAVPFFSLDPYTHLLISPIIPHRSPPFPTCIKRSTLFQGVLSHWGGLAESPCPSVIAWVPSFSFCGFFPLTSFPPGNFPFSPSKVRMYILENRRSLLHLRLGFFFFPLFCLSPPPGTSHPTFSSNSWGGICLRRSEGTNVRRPRGKALELFFHTLVTLFLPTRFPRTFPFFSPFPPGPQPEHKTDHQ